MKVFVLCILILFSTIVTASGYEQYEKDHITLNKPPSFCLIDFPEEPNVKEYIFFQTQKSIQQWNDAISLYYDDDFPDFEFKIVNSSDITHNCNVYIYYLELNYDGVIGVTHLGDDVSTIHIYYIDPVTDTIRSNLSYAIKHEIGHVLGLGHRDNSMHSISIMTLHTEYHKDYSKDSISTLDAYFVYNLYGYNSFAEINRYLNYND